MRWQDIKLVNSAWKEVTVKKVEESIEADATYKLENGKFVRIDQPEPSDKDIEEA